MKMRLAELIQKRNLYAKLYSGITDFDRIVKIDNRTIEPMEKILKAHDKMRETFQKELEDSKNDKKIEEVNSKYSEELEKEVNIDFVTVTKEEVKKAEFNVFEYRQIKHLIKD